MTKTGGDAVDPSDMEPKEAAARRHGYASARSLGAKIRALRQAGARVRSGHGWVSRSDLDAALAGVAPEGDPMVLVPVRLSDIRRVMGGGDGQD